MGLPSPFLTVIFTLDEPLRIAQQVDPAQPPGAYETLVGGLHTSRAVIEHDGAQSGIQLQLSPLSARALFGVPAGVLAGIDVRGTDLLGARASAVREQLCEAASWPRRFQVPDRELGRQLAESRRPPAEVCQAWRMLRASSGTVSIAQVAGEVGWSDRQLARGFRREIGLTRKAAARAIRFDRPAALRSPTGCIPQTTARATLRFAMPKATGGPSALTAANHGNVRPSREAASGWAISRDGFSISGQFADRVAFADLSRPDNPRIESAEPQLAADPGIDESPRVLSETRSELDATEMGRTGHLDHGRTDFETGTDR